MQAGVNTRYALLVAPNYYRVPGKKRYKGPFPGLVEPYYGLGYNLRQFQKRYKFHFQVSGKNIHLPLPFIEFLRNLWF